MKTAGKIARFVFIGAIFLAVVTAAFLLADFVTNNHIAQDIIGQFGYVGVIILALIAGLNMVVPVPAATFTPVFLAAGLWMPLIILMLVIGTMLADLIGYVFGKWSRSYVEEHYPQTYHYISRLNEEHRHLIIPGVILYAAMAPFPNEAILIPLAIVGFRFRQLLLPLFLGNLINQTALAYGASNIFSLLF